MGEIFKKVAIIGTGLMGGSLSMALKAHPGIEHVAVYDMSPVTRLKAWEMKIADEVTGSPGEAVRGCDLLFLATPISAMVEVVREAYGDLSTGAIISDLGSAKLETAAALGDVTPPGVHYVGGHPMTGSEQSGVEFASADLFQNCYWILTPTADTDSEAFRRLHGLITDMGAHVISMDPETHDEAMATVSHTPHLLSLLLMDMAGKQYQEMKSLFKVAAGGFRDMTRIAASSPDVWVDICMENRKFIVQRLLEYGLEITELIDMLENRDRAKLEELFLRASLARSELLVRAGREIDELFEVSLPVPDRPGVISEISTAVGSLGINIENVEIVHPLEGETGILTLKILGGAQAGEAGDKLESLGYKVAVREG